MLLEIDNEPVITQKLQSKLIELKRYFKEKKLTLRNFSIEDSSIELLQDISSICDFQISKKDKKKNLCKSKLFFFNTPSILISSPLML